ncbi:MAG: squalene/phytoene synthase family protein [Elusimicrobiota bacterium]
MEETYKKSNFSTAFFFLSRKQKYALSLIYKFSRIADDIADTSEDKEKKLKKLTELKEKTKYLYSTSEIKDDFFKNLKETVNEYKIEKFCFDELLNGMEKDIQGIDFKTLKELEEYMFQVASVVGIMVLDISGYKGKEKEDIAKYTGYALQLTNILRDILEDTQNNRFYIPQEHRISFLNSTKINFSHPEFKNLFEFEKEIALNYYIKANELYRRNKTKELFVSAIMKNIYFEIFKSLDFANLSKNHKISKYKKIKVLVKSFFETN